MSVVVEIMHLPEALRGMPPAGRPWGGASRGARERWGGRRGLLGSGPAPGRCDSQATERRGSRAGKSSSKAEARRRVREACGVGVLGPGRVAQVTDRAAAAAILPACGLPRREGRRPGRKWLCGGRAAYSG